MLAGIPVAAEVVRELARLVDEPAARTLLTGLESGRTAIALTIQEREQLLRGLENCPDCLAEFRGVPLVGHEWRATHGL